MWWGLWWCLIISLLDHQDGLLPTFALLTLTITPPLSAVRFELMNEASLSHEH